MYHTAEKKSQKTSSLPKTPIHLPQCVSMSPNLECTRRVTPSSCIETVAHFSINRKKLVLVYKINKKLQNIYMQRIYARSYRIEFKISNISCVDF